MDNVYEVTVVATDANGNRGMTMVTVTVENENENGVVTLSKTQPRVGHSGDGQPDRPGRKHNQGLKWQWYDPNRRHCRMVDLYPERSGAIEGGTSATYTPTIDDAGSTVILTGRRAMLHRRTTSQQIGDGRNQAAHAVAVDTRNKPPVFADQDMEMDRVTRTNWRLERWQRTRTAVSTDDAADVDGRTW